MNHKISKKVNAGQIQILEYISAGCTLLSLFPPDKSIHRQISLKMPLVAPEKLVALQQNPVNIRNVSSQMAGQFGMFANRTEKICILAHVVSQRTAQIK